MSQSADHIEAKDITSLQNLHRNITRQIKSKAARCFRDMGFNKSLDPKQGLFGPKRPRCAAAVRPPKGHVMNDMHAMDGFDIARPLEAFAERSGFVAPQAYYIVGEFSLQNADGSSAAYSDEAHLWCRDCADKLLAKAHALMPSAERENHFVCATDPTGEDTCPHCRGCGETLEGSVSEACVGEEVAHYDDNPICDGDMVNPRQAVEIAMILYAAPNDPDVIAIGRAALAAIARAEGRA